MSSDKNTISQWVVLLAFLLLVLCASSLFAEDDVSTYIDRCGHREYFVRRQATEDLYHALEGDWTLYTRLLTESTNPERSLEARTRLKYLCYGYFHEVFDPSFTVLTERVGDVFAGGKKIRDAFEYRFSLPTVYIWQLPDDQRYVNGEDRCDAIYKNAILTLHDNFDITKNPEIYNWELVMRYATLIWIVEEMAGGENPSTIIQTLTQMQVNQDEEYEAIQGTAWQRNWTGSITLRQVPASRQERFEALAKHGEIIPPEVLPNGGRSGPDGFNFNQFVVKNNLYISGPPASWETCP